MHSSRSRHAAGRQQQWSTTTDHYNPRASEYYRDAAPSYFGEARPTTAAPYPGHRVPHSHHPPASRQPTNIPPYSDNNSALFAFVDACKSLGAGSIPVGPPLSSQPPERNPHDFAPLHTSRYAGRPHSDNRAQLLSSDASSFLSRDSNVREFQPSVPFHDNIRHRPLEPDYTRRYDGQSSPAPVSIKMESHDRPPPYAFSTAVKKERSDAPSTYSSLQRDGNRAYREDDVPSFLRHDFESRYNPEHRRTSSRLSREMEFIADGSSVGRRAANERIHPHPRSLEPHSSDHLHVALSSNDIPTGRFSHHIERETGRPSANLSNIERHQSSQSPFSLSHQSHARHSPPPIQHYHPLEHHPRLERDYTSKLNVDGRLGPPLHQLQEDYNDPFLNKESFGKHQPPPSHHPRLGGPPNAPLSDRLGTTSHGPMVHSVQARLGPPRITEPVDHNPCIATFNAGPSARSENPFTDLRQTLDGHSRSTLSLSSESGFPCSTSPSHAPGNSSSLHHHPSPKRHQLSSPVRDQESSRRSPSPTQRWPPRRPLFSPPRPMSSPGHLASPQSHSTLSPIHSQSPPSCSPSPPPPGHPLSPRRCRPLSPRHSLSPSRSPSPRRHHPSSPRRHHPSSPRRRHQSSPRRRHQSSPRYMYSRSSSSRSPSPRRRYPSSSRRRHRSSPRHSMSLSTCSSPPRRHHPSSPRRHHQLSPRPSRSSSRSPSPQRRLPSSRRRHRPSTSWRHRPLSRHSPSPSSHSSATDHHHSHTVSQTKQSTLPIKMAISTSERTPLSSTNSVNRKSPLHPKESGEKPQSSPPPKPSSPSHSLRSHKSSPRLPSSGDGTSSQSTARPLTQSRRNEIKVMSSAKVSQQWSSPLPNVKASPNREDQSLASSLTTSKMASSSKHHSSRINANSIREESVWQEKSQQKSSSLGEQQPSQGVEQISSPFTKSVDDSKLQMSDSKTEEFRGSTTFYISSGKLQVCPVPRKQATFSSSHEEMGTTEHRRPGSASSLRSTAPHTSPVSVASESPRDNQFDPSHNSQQKTSEVNFKAGGDETAGNVLDLPTSQASSCNSSLSPLWQTDFTKPAVSGRPLFSATIGIPVSSKHKSMTSSPSTQPFVINLDSSDGGVDSSNAAPSVSDASLFPAPLSQTDESALPFSNFLNSRSHEHQGVTSSPSAQPVEDSADSDNEGALVIDEGVVSNEDVEMTSKIDDVTSVEEVLASSKTVLSDPTSTYIPPSTESYPDSSSGSDCEIVNVTRGSKLNTPRWAIGHTSSKASKLPVKKKAKKVKKPVTTRAPQRTKKMAADIIGLSVVDELVGGKDDGNNLLCRFFNAVVVVTNCWKMKLGNLVSKLLHAYCRQAFDGFVSGTITSPWNQPTDLFKKELQSLKTKCGTNVSKWTEQIQRYILVANTLSEKKNLKTLLVKKAPTLNTATLGSKDSDTSTHKTTSASQVIPPLFPPRDEPSEPSRVSQHTPTASESQVKHMSAFSPVLTISTSASSQSFQPRLLHNPGTSQVDLISTTSFVVSSLASPTKPVTVISRGSISVVTKPSSSDATSCLFTPVVSASSESRCRMDRSGDDDRNSELDRVQSEQSSDDKATALSRESDSYLSKTVGSCHCKVEPLACKEVSSVSMESSGSDKQVELPQEATDSETLSATEVGSTSRNSTETCSSLSISKSETCDSSAEERYDAVLGRVLSPGEIVSSSPSPEPENSTSSSIPLAYRDPVQWKKLGSKERELPARRQTHPSSSLRSPSPDLYYRRRDRITSTSRERFYRRSRSRERSRCHMSREQRSRSHDRISRSRDWVSRSRDRRSRSRECISRPREHRSRSRDRSYRERRHYSKARSPRRRLGSQRSGDSRRRSSDGERDQRRSSCSSKHGRRSPDSEDDLEVLKEKALATMKQQQKSARTKMQEPMEVFNESGKDHEIDMEICSILSGSEEGANTGDVIEKGQSEMEVKEKTLSNGGKVVSPEGMGSDVSSMVKVSSFTDLEMVQNDAGVSREASTVVAATTTESESANAETEPESTSHDNASSKAICLVPSMTVQQPIGRSVSAPSDTAATVVAKQHKPSVVADSALPTVKRSLTSSTINQPSVGVAQSSVGVASPTGPAALKRTLSRPNSQSGSKTNSPCRSPVHVPSPAGSTDSVASSVKVLPGNKATWDIQRLLIVNSQDDTESESEESSASDTESTSVPVSSELSDISRLLLKAKATAEEKAALESQQCSLKLPTPPASLNSAQKKEYLELQRKLALHTKKKALRTGPSVQSNLLTRAKVKAKQPVDPWGKKIPVKGSTKRISLLKKPVQILAKEEPKKVSAKNVHQAKNTAALAKKKSKVESDRLERTIQQHREKIRLCQNEQTNLTNQLTDSVSKIEELELEMEQLRKALKQEEQKRCELVAKLHSNRETISSSNNIIEQLKSGKEPVDKENLPSSTLATISQYDNVSGAESTVSGRPVNSAAENSFKSYSSGSVLNPVYETISNEEGIKSNTCNKTPAIEVEAVADAETLQDSMDGERPSSSLSVEKVGNNLEQSNNSSVGRRRTVGETSSALDSEHSPVVSDQQKRLQNTPSCQSLTLPPSHLQVASASASASELESDSMIWQGTRAEEKTAEATRGVDCAGTQSPAVALKIKQQKVPRLASAKKSSRSSKGAPKVDNLTSKARHSKSFKRRMSAGVRRKRAKTLQLERQLSLPTFPTSESALSSPMSDLTDQEVFSNKDGVPKILSELITSLNRRTIQSVGLSSTHRPTSSYPTLATPPSASTLVNASGEGLAGHCNPSRVPSILNDLVTYLTTETVQRAGHSFNTHASLSNSESAIKRTASEGESTMKVEMTSSFFLVSDSERAPLVSDYEASCEYESDECVMRQRKRHYIDADCLFHPGTDALFTAGADVPPMFTLPRLASAGDFPLEVDPSCISSIALDMARQCVIHAPPNNDLLRGTAESELSQVSDAGNLRSELEGKQEEAEKLDNKTTESARQGSGHTQAPPIRPPTIGKAEVHLSKHLVINVPTQAPGKITSSALTKLLSASGGKSSKASLVVATGTKSDGKKIVKGSGGAVHSKVKGITTKEDVAKVKVQGMKGKGNKKLERQLNEHLAKLEELKGNLASKSTSQTTSSGTSGSSGGRSKETWLVAETSKLQSSSSRKTIGDLKIKLKRVTETKSTKREAQVPATSAVSKSSFDNDMAEITKVIKGEWSKSGAAPSSLADQHSLSGTLNRYWLSSQQRLLDTEPHPLPVMSSDGGCSTIPSCGLAISLSHSASSGEKIVNLEILEKLKKHSAPTPQQSSEVSLQHKGTPFCPYSSPLLMFQSYRLNPLYRTNEKLSLQSLTHSNKIDPNKIMCRYELGGVCKNASCAGQHFKDITFNKEELVQDLVCYAPQLAGCSVHEVDGESLIDSQNDRETKKKIALFASQMVERYSSKVKDEDIYKLTVHDVNKERLKADSKAKAGYISYDDRAWLTGKDDTETSSLSVEHPISFMAKDLSVDKAESEGDRLDQREDGGMEWDSISKDLMPVWRQNQDISSQKLRYFSVEEDSSPTLPPAGGADSAKSPAPTVKDILQSVARARASGDGTDALIKILLEGLQMHMTSEELWIEYLRVQCSDQPVAASQDGRPTLEGVEAPPTSSGSAGGGKVKDKAELFYKAITATNSYTVGLECIRLADGYDMKRKCTRETVRLIKKLHPEPHPLYSHQSLELMVNTCVLEQLRGKPPSEAIAAIKALPHYSTMLNMLTIEDLQLLCLVYIHMTYTGTVPLCLLDTPTCGYTHPVKLGSKEPFLINWSKTRKLNGKDRDSLQNLFEGCLVLCVRDDEGMSSLYVATSPESSFVLSCLSLYKNFVLFQSVHGDVEAALSLLQHLVSVCPTVPDLWIVYTRVLENAGRDVSDVLLRATQECRRSAELFHMAARLSLSHQSRDSSEPTTSVEKAVHWLKCCVSNFFMIPPGSEVELEETKMLYRKLLQQMLPYDLNLPEFAAGVDPRDLGNTLAPLWLCYCLLVELTLPSLVTSCSEFHHLSVEEAFEAAILSVHSPSSAVQSIWMEYLLYLRSKVLEGDVKLKVSAFSAFSSAVYRCLIAADYTRPSPVISDDISQAKSFHDDYTFHDQVIDIFSSVFPPHSTFLLSQLQKFRKQLPKSPKLVASLVRCALAQTPTREDLAQTALATYLANNPRCDFLWRMAGAVEQRLGNVKEARWIYHQSVRISPSNADLWKDFLLFELKEAFRCRNLTLSLSLISTLLKKSRHSGIGLWQTIKVHSTLHK